MKKLLALAGCVLFTACVPHPPATSTSSSSSSAFVTETLTVTSASGESTKVAVEIAFTEEERALGLMHRTSLAQDHGMLFVFEQPQVLSFWMKNTKIPLEVLFFDDQGNFVSMQSMVPCIADPCMSYPSTGIAQYALEVNPGFAAAHQIGLGTTIDYTKDGPE